MPSALPGLSPGKAAEILQQTDKLIATVPEVKSVFGKIGRAETATDPAPLEMIETTIQFKPQSEWRPGMTPDKLVEELCGARAGTCGQTSPSAPYPRHRVPWSRRTRRRGR